MEENLRQLYGDSVRIEVGSLDGRRHLEVRLEAFGWDTLPDAQVPYQALEVARQAWSRHPRPDQLRELTVSFVKFIPGRDSWCFSRSTGFRNSGGPTPEGPALAITRVEYPSGGCPAQPDLPPPQGCQSCETHRPGASTPRPDSSGQGTPRQRTT